jgi:hypothetical protein
MMLDGVAAATVGTLKHAAAATVRHAPTEATSRELHTLVPPPPD